MPAADDRALLLKHKKTKINEAFKVNYTLIQQMALKSRYGFSRFMQKYHDCLFTFFQFDLVLGMILVQSGIYPVYIYEKVAAVNIFIKGIMMMIMTIIMMILLSS